MELEELQEELEEEELEELQEEAAGGGAGGPPPLKDGDRRSESDPGRTASRRRSPSEVRRTTPDPEVQRSASLAGPRLPRQTRGNAAPCGGPVTDIY